MRKLGFLLLIIGFLWLCWTAWSMRPIARAVVANHYDHLSHAADARFSVADVQREMADVAFDSVDHIRFIFIASCIMLAGGLFLAFAGRSVKTHAP
jgi:hypothetical protein